MIKKKLLFMLQVPPPVHGAALRNKSLLESKLLNDEFEIKLHPVKFANTIADIGKVSFKKILKIFSYAFGLLKNLIFFRPKIAYFTIAPVGGAFLRDALFVLILRIFSVKRVFHLRGLGIKREYKKKWKKRIYNFVFKGSYVIILNNNQKEDVDFLPFKKLFIVPNGMRDESILIKKKPEKVELSLLYLSNYVKDKGALLFVDIVESLIDKGYPVTGMMAGNDADVTKEDLKGKICEKKLNDKIIVNGPVFEEEKFKLFHKSDIFIFPSYIDLNPGVVIEAMQCSLPVVSTPIGGIPELIDVNSTGLIVDKIDCGSFVEKIEFLIQNSEVKKEYGIKGRAKYLSAYNQESFEKNIKETFTKILND